MEMAISAVEICLNHDKNSLEMINCDPPNTYSY